MAFLTTSTPVLICLFGFTDICINAHHLYNTQNGYMGSLQLNPGFGTILQSVSTLMIYKYTRYMALLRAIVLRGTLFGIEN